MPNLLYNLLAWFMSEDVPPLTSESQGMHHVPSAEVNCVALAVAHYIIYMYPTTHGRIKCEKHISLPMAVWHLTGSKQVIALLNCFGLGMVITEL